MNDEILDWKSLMQAEKKYDVTGATLCDINAHVVHARQKHPWPDGMTAQEKYRVAERELLEMSAAMLKGNERGAREEALDCAAVLIRIVEGE